MRNKSMILVLLSLTVFTLGFSSTESYPWRDHASPFDFLFGNHIDTHQQSKTLGNGQLQGFFYIRFTGEYTEEGYPIAKHANCAQVPDECTVGWTLHGVPVSATLLAHEPGQHPTWYVDPADMPQQPGYTHFHWLGAPEHAHDLTISKTYDGFLLKLSARDTFFFEHHGGFLITPGIDYASHANVVTSLE